MNEIKRTSFCENDANSGLGYMDCCHIAQKVSLSTNHGFLQKLQTGLVSFNLSIHHTAYSVASF